MTLKLVYIGLSLSFFSSLDFWSVETARTAADRVFRRARFGGWCGVGSCR